MSPRKVTSSRQSARAGARRPQLVPRERVVAPPRSELEDLDARLALERTGDAETDEFDAMLDGADAYTPPMPEQMHGAAEAIQAETRTPITPEPEPTPQTADIELTNVTYEDFDRMWDWVREDKAGTAKFLGFAPATSRNLFNFLRQMMQYEAQGTALARSIYIVAPNRRAHLGFVVLNPISRGGAENVAYVHTYLAPMVQGQLPKLLPSLVDIAGDQFPDLHLVVQTADYAFAKLLQPHGFQLSIALTRPPVHKG